MLIAEQQIFVSFAASPIIFWSNTRDQVMFKEKGERGGRLMGISVGGGSQRNEFTLN